MLSHRLRPIDLLYLHCFPAFVEAAFPIVYPGKTLHDGWHLRAVCRYLQDMFEGRKPQNLVLNLPPRSLKTFIVSICFPAWCLIRDPSLSIIVATYGDDLSRKVGRQFRELMESELVIRLSNGNLADVPKSSETEYETPQSGGRFATSEGGVLTGRGADILITDDPMKADDAYSETARRRTRDWYMTAAHSRRNRPAKAIMIVSMQRLHVDDLSGTLLERGWPGLAIPSIAIDEGKFDLGGGVWHKRMPGDLLQNGWDSLQHFEEIKTTAGSHVFSAQWQQQPLPEEGTIVKRAWMKPYKSPPPLEQFSHIYVVCDPAGAAGSNNDFTAIVVAGVIDRDVYVLEVSRGHWECLEISRRMIATAENWRATQVIIETTGQGESVRQEIARGARFDIKGITQSRNKLDRLWRVIGRFEAGRVKLPHEAEWLADFDAELFGFPNGRYDDQVDALVMALEDLAEWESHRTEIPTVVLYVPECENRFSMERFTNRG
jgi:predicted phage terminase large subunit-like protein